MKKERVLNVRKRLQDKESCFLFDARLKMAEEGDRDSFITEVCSYYTDFITPQWSKLFSKDSELVLCGFGDFGKRDYRTFKTLGYHVLCFADNGKSGYYEGIPIMSFVEAVRNYPSASFVVTTSRYEQEIIKEAELLGVSSNLAVYNHSRFLAMRGNQYFDVFSPMAEEVFIDCGAYKGDTIEAAFHWTDNIEIYSLEPGKEAYDELKTKYTDSRIHLFNYAAWNCAEKLSFVEDGAGSYVDSIGDSIQGMDIDSIVGDTKVTFIKMDIEGSELKALEGAARTIRRDHPRLTICIYHKDFDVIDIPEYILSLDPSYQFRIRHYSTWDEETVLYAE